MLLDLLKLEQKVTGFTNLRKVHTPRGQWCRFQYSLDQNFSNLWRLIRVRPVRESLMSIDPEHA